MSAPASLSDLLTYIEEVERLNKTPAFQVPSDVFSLFSAEFTGLPGVQLDLEQDGPVWLVVARLQEQLAPPAPGLLAEFVAVSAVPDTLPVFTAPEGMGAAELMLLSGEFDAYLADEWHPWAALEIPRRHAILLYKKLFALQQKLAGESDTPLELVWGAGIANWTPVGGKSVRYPLLTQGCFIELDKETFTLTVRPRDVEPNLELDCYVELEAPGVAALESFWLTRKNVFAGFNPLQPDTFVDVLQMAVGCLDPAGSISVAEAGSGASLVVSQGWVLFARKRSADVFVEDVRRFQAELLAGEPIPDVVQSFVTEALDVVQDSPNIEFRGLSSSSMAPGVQELYFPLPYNAEQVDIVRKLEGSNGVVVQGPPGTGKTHTIANIVAHYLAQGKRVLVTSKGDTALSVLRDKLPEGIRDLSVALLANERAGMKQFEHSIQQIASQVAAIRPASLEAGISHAEQALAHTHAKLAYVDQQIADISGRNDDSYILSGKSYSAEELAQLVAVGLPAAAWLRDEISPDTAIPFSEDECRAVRSARTRLGASLAYLGDVIPAEKVMASWPELRTHRANLLREQTLLADIAGGRVLVLANPTVALSQLEQVLTVARAVHAKVSSTPDALFARAIAYPLESPVAAQLQDMALKLGHVELVRQQLLAAAIMVPDGAELNSEFVEALERLVEGKSAFGFGGLFGGKKEVQRLLDQCLVLGAPVKTQALWGTVATILPWRQEVRALIHRWNAMCSEFCLPMADAALEAGLKQVASHLPKVVDALQVMHAELPALRQQVVGLFGLGVSEKVNTAAGIGEVVDHLQAHLELTALREQSKAHAVLVQALEVGRGALNQRMLDFIQVRLANPSEAEGSLADAWLAMCQEAGVMRDKAPDFGIVQRAAAHLQALGLTGWSAALAGQPVGADCDDQALPLGWRAHWDCKVADSMLDAVDAHDELRALFAQRAELTEHLARTYGELVASRAWLGVYRNSTDKTKQALQSFLASIQAMGAGTGIRAVRHRRAARVAMEKAYLSVPCWVLPQWRISETLPAEMGLFDLVVIDEASQSDVSSLPAILRGKKLLVVGDHKQVSPSAVGVSEAKISSVFDRLLKNQPHGAHMTADKSIYDLARVVFAGQSVMLKEHFRCVPAIIEYSNREFYNGEIRALRVPRAGAQVLVPLVDVHVTGGYRTGDKNIPEATAIVDEIQALLANPQMAGKSIGVVTLVGHEQAKLINDQISVRISPEEILDREIVVGQPPAFQGRERDIILISMVQAPGDRSFSSALQQQQRLNVALSRARDRMYLFRSVPDSQFPADSMSGRLIGHFKQPFQVPAGQANLRELCESGFERDMFDALVARGYRVTPQVKTGGYRIDLVVEGVEGRRLAVECDGDRFHGPDKWAEDMARQRVLERAGWSFWRCFASSFNRRRQSVLQDLASVLAAQGIEPLGDAPTHQHYTEMRQVDPMGVAP